MDNVTNLIVSRLHELDLRFDKIVDEKDKATEIALKGILASLNARDQYSFDHCKRVCFYALLVGLDQKISDRELYDLQLASLFHDIGKIAMPDSILNKVTRLNDTEYRVMQSHPTRSFEILNEFDHLSNVAKSALHHHERFDGRGYPDKLSGENIPLAARVIAICDTFDSMTSARAYRSAFPVQIVLNELNEFAGAQFDPNLVESFMRVFHCVEIERDFYVPLLDRKKGQVKKAA
ncbi:MAG: hypothetical protein CME62_01150 [Halobacteriovoraceae bacterium]|nr:hypothetical protein [Halobacteriovoraceae bacterium]|tara:strand:- start:9010 stop:9714 length:705 start_codon:yes stop_codon:yes gene_type:complete